MRGVYRYGNGTIRGKVSGAGVFRGVWCEGRKRPPDTSGTSSQAGFIEWRLVDTRSEGRLIVGARSYGLAPGPAGKPAATAGWDLRKLKIDKAPDLDRRLTTESSSRFCTMPR